MDKARLGVASALLAKKVDYFAKMLAKGVDFADRSGKIDAEQFRSTKDTKMESIEKTYLAAASMSQEVMGFVLDNEDNFKSRTAAAKKALEKCCKSGDNESIDSIVCEGEGIILWAIENAVELHRMAETAKRLRDQ